MVNLAVNSGSTSLKVVLMNSEGKNVSAKWEKAFSQITFKVNGEKNVIKIDEGLESHTALIRIISYFQKLGLIKTLSDIEKVGYRVVHGGNVFTEPTKVDRKVIEKLKEIDYLSINHNPVTRRTVEEGVKLLPNATHVLCFDTTFHRTIPTYANMYGISMDYYNAGIRKYGFHGISVEYVARKTAELLEKDFSSFSGIICHLGGGSSITAIQNGKSIDSTMGYTPVDGLVMGQRSGSVDPEIVKAIMEYEKCDVDKATNILSTQSGFLGIAGTSDYIILREKAKTSEGEKARIALDLFMYQIRKYIGSFAAIMDNIDAVVFTGGIGENDTELVKKVVNTTPLKRIGIMMENNNPDIFAKSNLIPALQIPTNEELAIIETLKQF